MGKRRQLCRQSRRTAGQVGRDSLQHRFIPLPSAIVHDAGAAGIAEIQRNGAVARQNGRYQTGDLQDVARGSVGLRVTPGQFTVYAGSKAQGNVAARAFDDRRLAAGFFTDMFGFPGRVGGFPDRRSAVGKTVLERGEQVFLVSIFTQAGEGRPGGLTQIDMAVLLTGGVDGGNTGCIHAAGLQITEQGIECGDEQARRLFGFADFARRHDHAVMLEAESGEARIVTVSEGFAPDDYASGDFQ